MIAEAEIDSYLSTLRGHLGPLTLNDREEIVREIYAHIRDAAEQSGAGVDTVLARLGPVEELAAQYRDGLLIRQASQSVSPVKLLRGALRLATKGVAGMVVFFVGILGYSMGGGLALSGLLKPVFPTNTGVWFQDGRLLGFGTQFYPPPPPAHELMGMWYVPVMLTMGSLTLMLTTFLIRTSLRISQRWQAKL